MNIEEINWEETDREVINEVMHGRVISSIMEVQLATRLCDFAIQETLAEYGLIDTDHIELNGELFEMNTLNDVLVFLLALEQRFRNKVYSEYDMTDYLAQLANVLEHRENLSGDEMSLLIERKHALAAIEEIATSNTLTEAEWVDSVMKIVEDKQSNAIVDEINIRQDALHNTGQCMCTKFRYV